MRKIIRIQDPTQSRYSALIEGDDLSLQRLNDALTAISMECAMETGGWIAKRDTSYLSGEMN